MHGEPALLTPVSMRMRRLPSITIKALTDKRRLRSTSCTCGGSWLKGVLPLWRSRAGGIST